MIDLMSQWIDDGKIMAKDLGKICRGLELFPSATNQRHLLLSKLVARCRSLVNALDAATCSISDTVQDLASSTTEKLQAACTAHDIPTYETDMKGNLIERMIDHISQGECAKELAPGCDHCVSEALPSIHNVLYVQLSVLQSIEPVLNASQLYRVLDIYGVTYSKSDSRKRLKMELWTYI